MESSSTFEKHWKSSRKAEPKNMCGHVLPRSCSTRSGAVLARKRTPLVGREPMIMRFSGSKWFCSNKQGIMTLDDYRCFWRRLGDHVVFLCVGKACVAPARWPKLPKKKCFVVCFSAINPWQLHWLVKKRPVINVPQKKYRNRKGTRNNSHKTDCCDS